MNSIEFEVTTWNQSKEQLLSIRTEVFVEEQSVPMHIEIDEFDLTATHFLATDQVLPIGTARIVLDDNTHVARVGRVAILKSYRRQGIGYNLMRYVENWIKQHTKSTSIHLHAQLQSIPFYERLGYITKGNLFEEAGIPHQFMEKTL